MFIFGNAKVLQKYDLWNNLLNVYKKQNCLLEGSDLDALKICPIILREPVKYNADKKAFILTETALSNFDKEKGKKTGLKKLESDFDTLSEVSKSESQISYGSRVSAYGFTDMFGLSKTTPNTFDDEELIEAPLTGLGGNKKGRKQQPPKESSQGKRLRNDADFSGDFMSDMGMK